MAGMEEMDPRDRVEKMDRGDLEEMLDVTDWPVSGYVIAVAS